MTFLPYITFTKAIAIPSLNTPTHTMATASNALTPDDVDDLIYACRTDALDWLTEMLTTWSKQMNTSESQIIRTAIDVDDEGMGSRACLLHYPAANGNITLVQYLLDKLAEDETQANVNGGAPRTSFVNHQNINGNTPLHWAALNGHLEIVKALVKAGADPTIVNEAGRDAVVEAEYSAKEKAAECAEWLLKECEALEKGAGGVQAEERLADTGEEDAKVTADESLPNGNH